VCGRCRAPLEPGAVPLNVTDDTFESLVLGSPLPVLLDLWAPWCAPCLGLAPVIEQVAVETAGRLRVAKLDTDENPRTAARLQVRGIPTLVFFKEGREVERLVGARAKAEILQAAAGLGIRGE